MIVFKESQWLDQGGQLLIEDTSYALKKGDHFILPNDVVNWTFDGQLELIASHPNN